MAVNHPVGGSTPSTPAKCIRLKTINAVFDVQVELYVRNRCHNLEKPATLQDIKDVCNVMGIKFLTKDIETELQQLRHQNNNMLNLLKACNKFLINSGPPIQPHVKQFSQNSWWNIIKEIGIFFQDIK